MKLFISKDNLNRWLEDLQRERILIAPAHVEELALFQPVTRVEEVVLDSGNTVLSPKAWFLPPTETLFSILSSNGQRQVVPASVEKESVIFGLRPCDASGIALMDKPLLQKPGDALYRERRAKTTLVGLACRQAQPECFCTSVGSAPNDASHLDILLTEIEGGYLIQAVTEKGKKLLPRGLAESKAALPTPPEPRVVPVKEVTHTIREVFNNPYWERLADRCLHCNVCSYVCPVCYCFNVRDYTNKEWVERVRSWESCQSPGFTRIAGGYDHRPTKGARLRQRFFHKLLYFPEQFQDVACTGCGRCVLACPVNIDIREVISNLQQLEAKSGSR